MFRLKKWDDPQIFLSNRWLDPNKGVEQKILQVWFAGVHADIGGGYPEAESAISKYPLLWMIEEARQFGLTVNTRTVNKLAWGRQREPNPTFRYVEPDVGGRVHNSMNWAWRLLEMIPKNSKHKEWPPRRSFLGDYIPCGEPRFIPEGAVIHDSVVERMAAGLGYKPVNLPKDYKTFPMPVPPHAATSDA
jgi:hypothetical protein